MNMVKYAVAVLVMTSVSGLAQIEPPNIEGNNRDEIKNQNKHEQKTERKGTEERGDRMEMLLNRLSENQKLREETGITEEQITKIRDSLDELKKKLIDLRGEMEKASIDQAKLISAKELDEAAVMKAIEKIGALRTDMAKLEIQKRLVIKKNLKQEQVEKLMKSVQQMKTNMGEAREKIKEKRQGGSEEKHKSRKGDSENEDMPPIPPTSPENGPDHE